MKGSFVTIVKIGLAIAAIGVFLIGAVWGYLEDKRDEVDEIYNEQEIPGSSMIENETVQKTFRV